MTSIPVQLSAPLVLAFSLLLGLVCWACVILLFRFDCEPRDPEITRHWIRPYGLFASPGFVLAVTGLSVLLIRLPPCLTLFS